MRNLLLLLLLLMLAYPPGGACLEAASVGVEATKTDAVADTTKDDEEMFPFDDEEEQYSVSDPLEPVNRGIFWLPVGNAGTLARGCTKCIFQPCFACTNPQFRLSGEVQGCR